MAKIEINIIKEDIKKDLINFLIGIAEAGISAEFFPEIASLFNKAKSETIDVEQFNVDLLTILKKDNNIKNGDVDFTTFVETRKINEPFRSDGDTISVSSLIDKTLNKSSNEKILKDQNKEDNDLVPTGEGDNKDSQTLVDKEDNDLVPTGEGDSKTFRDIEDQYIEDNFEKTSAPDEYLSVNNNYYTDGTNITEPTLEGSKLVGDSGIEISPLENNATLDGTVSSKFKISRNVNPDDSDSVTAIEQAVIKLDNEKIIIQNNIEASNKTFRNIGDTGDTIGDTYGSTKIFTIGNSFLKNSTNEELITQSYALTSNKAGDIEEIKILAEEAVEGIVSEANSKQFKKLEVLYRNIIPYGAVGNLAVSTAKAVENLLNGTSNDFSINGIYNFVSGVSDVFDAVGKVKYFNARELGLYYAGAANFYTLLENRGITIKDLNASKAAGFGVDFSPLLTKSYFVNYPQLNKKLNLDASQNTIPKDLISNLTSILPIGGDIEDAINFWSDVKTILTLTKSVETELRLQGTESKIGTVLPAPDNVSGKPSGSGTNVSIQDIELLKRAGLSTLELEQFSNTGFIGTVNKAGNDDKSKTNEISLSDLNTKYKIRYEEEEEENKNKNKNRTFSELTTAITKKLGDVIGSVYVMPVGEGLEPKFIPFQFNPNITEAGISARYTATSILNRIGNLQSFTGVDSLVVTIEAKYFAISNKNNDFFSMKDIQGIEMLYRSLVYPWNEGEGDNYSYHQPPYVKIVMGNAPNKIGTAVSVNNTGPYSNLLTRPKEMYTPNSSAEATYKTFIVTNVGITKSEETPYYIKTKDSEINLMDFMGFTVSLNMIEVAMNYNIELPGFDKYYNNAYRANGQSNTV